MAECDRCGLAVFGGGDAVDTAVVERFGTWCPLCLLDRAPPDADLPASVERTARSALSMETRDELRRRVVERLAPGATDDRRGAFRTGELRLLATALGVPPDAAAALTNRELRARVAASADVDATPSAAFRKDDLVGIVLHVVRTVEEGEADQTP